MPKPKLKIVPVNERLLCNAKEILADAADHDFETVIVFGFKQGNIHNFFSESQDRLQVAGALEKAKLFFLKDHYNDL